MAPAAKVVQCSTSSAQSLLEAELKLWHHAMGFIKSLALKSALDLHIADAISHHGGSATLPEIATAANLHPSKLSCLGRLMRVLTVTGVFTVDDGGVYGLTPASRLFFGSPNVAPLLTMTLDSVLVSRPANVEALLACESNPQTPFQPNPLAALLVSPFFRLGEWLQREELPEEQSLFEAAHGQNLWDLAADGGSSNFGVLFNQGMIADSNFIVDVAVKECGDVFRGLSSLIDVGGGLGGAAQTIAKAFPQVTCSVLELPHIVDKAPSGTSVKYIAGDMFESIPPANAIFLKWIMHDWGDTDCIKILKNCKKAIPPRDAGGKVIILDMVVGVGSANEKLKETQVLFDLFIMTVNGTERDEQEWKKLIFKAGFSDYKIIPVLGIRSIIEVYP
ncbi:hypothetical protein EJB05_13299, partial [Eragrostis curvula]